MIRIAVSGVGRMGSYHLSVYERLMSEGYPVEVAAVCDVDPLRLDGSKSTLSNIAASGADITAYRSYTSLDELLEKEDIDAVDIVMPTYLHASAAEKVLLSGRHCMCEKPMALNAAECGRMIAASGSSGKTLMIGHCLRFWREYVYLKRISDSGVYGASRAAVLWRGGFQDHEKSPSWQDWIITREKGGGGPAHTRCRRDKVDIRQAGFGKRVRQDGVPAQRKRYCERQLCIPLKGNICA